MIMHIIKEGIHRRSLKMYFYQREELMKITIEGLRQQGKVFNHLWKNPRRKSLHLKSSLMTTSPQIAHLTTSESN